MFDLPWDRHKYIEIAANGPLNFHIAPYCWRIGKPWMAALLPLDLEMSFLFISFACVVVSGVLSWLIAREAGFSRAPRLIDIPTARYTLRIAVLPLIMFVGIRLAIPAWNDDPDYIATLPERLWLVRNGSSEYDLPTAMREEARNRFERLDLGQVRIYIVGTFGLAATLLPFFAWRSNLSWLARFVPFLLMVAAQMLFGHDIERYLILAFAAVLIMALNGLVVVSERLHIPVLCWIVVPIVLTGFELALVNEFFLPFRFQVLALVVAIVLIAILRQFFSYQND